MRLLRSSWFLMLFVAMVALPAVAQFEVSPDHFGDDSANVRQPGSAGPAASLQQQIAQQRTLLANYRIQIQRKAALVRTAQLDLQLSAPGANDSTRSELQKQQSELQRLRRSLAEPMHNAEAALARLEQRQQASRVGKARQVPDHAGETLSASK